MPGDRGHGGGQVLYKTEHNRLARFPVAASDDLATGPMRNFQVFEPLDFLAEVTQHISEAGEHLIRYYGWYSNKSRGVRAENQGSAATMPMTSTSPSSKEALAAGFARMLRTADLQAFPPAVPILARSLS